MKKPSKTAELVCAARATHTLQDENPVYSDPLAVDLCGDFWKRVANSKFLYWFMVKVLLRKLAPIVPEIIIRAKFCREVLDDFAQAGLKQFVILGAGYDSLAYQDDFPTNIKVFEIDLEVTQAEKKVRLAKINKHNLPHVKFIPADLNTESLEDVLRKNEFDFSKKSLISWFGVTYYINRDAFLSTLTFVKEHLAPGSAIIFDFLLPIEEIPQEWKTLAERCEDFVKSKGEPWINRMDKGQLESDLQNLGFASPQILMPTTIEQKYAFGRKDLVYPHVMGFCLASLPK